MWNLSKTWEISCQNGCDSGKMHYQRKSTMLIQEVKTGKVRAYCQKCSNMLPEEEFILWPKEGK